MKHLGGAELNIASEIGQLGLNTAIISKIPTNLLAAFIKNQLNASRVSENYLIEDHSDDTESAFTTMNMVLIQENPVLSMTENTLPLII